MSRGSAAELESLRTLVEELRTENEHLRGNQSELEASRADYVERFDAAAVPSFVLDERGIIRAANEAATERLSCATRDLVGSRLGRFVIPLDRPLLVAHLRRTLRNRRDACELRLRTTSGGNLLLRVWSRRAPGDGTTLHTSLVDLSEHERAKVESADLRDAVEAARKANLAKDKFIAMLSHELRTPLTPVLIAARAYRDQPQLPSQVRDTFAMIVRSVELESRLVDDLLDVTRIVQGKMRVVPVAVDLHQLLRRVCETLAPELETKRQNLWMELHADQSRVEVDPVRMHQLFSNLLKNAVKFSPVGGDIRVRSWNAPSKLVVEVEDNGVGIEAAELAQIFEPFTQLEADEPSAHGSLRGLGLGLTISKGIVDLHGGRVEAVSRGRGLGSRFVVQLPTTTKPAASLPDEGPLARPAKAAPPAADKDKRRVLLVEDHLDTAELITEYLESEGFEVARASTIEDALGIDLDKVDVIVSDLGLPDGDGRDLIRKLQETGHHPAIALSGYGMDHDVESSLKAGFDLHLTKPIDPDRLVDSIRGLASRGA